MLFKRQFILISQDIGYLTQSTHPNQRLFSAHNGFFGCGVFKKIDDHLDEQNMGKIKW
jgi:uracil DNA glycosylase